MSSPFSAAETPSAPPMSPKKKGLIIAGILLALIVVIVLVVMLCVVFLGSDSIHDQVLATQIKSLMDIEVNPCEDFYSYACGSWVRAQNSTQRMAFGTSMSNERDKRILEFLKTPIEVDDPLYTQIPKMFFDLCKNTQRINELGNKPFLDFLNDVGQFPLLDPSWREEDFDFYGVLAKLAPLGVSTFFKTDVAINEWMITIGVFLPETYLIDTLRKPYRQWTKEMFTFLGVNVVAQNEEIEDLFKIDEKIVTIKKESTTEEDNDLTVQELANRAPWFPWRELFFEISDGVLNVTQDVRNMLITTVQLNKVSKMEGIVNSTSKRTLANYLLKSMLGYMSALDTTLPSSPWRFYNFLPAKYPLYAREERCLFETRALFPEPIHRMYHDKFFNEGSVPFIKEMMDDLKDVYSNIINEAKWLDESKRLKYKEQVKAKDLLMGNPAFLFDDGLLNSMYLDIPFEGDYFTNVIALTRHRYRNAIKDAFSELDVIKIWKLHWDDPFRSDGFNIFQQKEFGDFITPLTYVFLPPDLVQMPVFNPKWRSSMKYGALGSVISHHMMHAITRDLYGSDEEYKKRRSCIIGHYGSMAYRDVKVNCAFMSNPAEENECDIQGIKVSFKAYRNFVERHGEEHNLQTLNLSPNQIFFVSYAQMMCEWIPIGSERDSFEGGRFPFHVKVNGALRQTKDFAEAFGCEPGSKMNPKNQCRVL